MYVFTICRLIVIIFVFLCWADLNDWLGYEGDHNSATECSSEGELDFADYYQRRQSEDLQQSRPRERSAKKRSQEAKKSRMARVYSSGDEEYMNEVEIIDMRAEVSLPWKPSAT